MYFTWAKTVKSCLSPYTIKSMQNWVIDETQQKYADSSKTWQLAVDGGGKISA